MGARLKLSVYRYIYRQQQTPAAPATPAGSPNKSVTIHAFNHYPASMKRLLLLTALPFALAACGFHLKGMASGDNRLRAVQLTWSDGGDSDFAQALQDALRQQDIAVEDGASVRVAIAPTEQQRIRTAIGGSGNTEEIELIDSVRIRAEKDGAALGEQTFSSRGNVRYRSNTYLGSQQEETEMHQQLARDNADKLIRYLNARLR